MTNQSLPGVIHLFDKVKKLFIWINPTDDGNYERWGSRDRINWIQLNMKMTPDQVERYTERLHNQYRKYKSNVIGMAA